MTPLSEIWTRWAPIFWLLSVLLLLWFAFQQQFPVESWRYERALLSSEPWRAVAHMFVHLNLAHLSLNAGALIIMFFLFQPAFRSSIWFVVLLFTSVCSAIGLYYFSPSIDWVAGMSGSLHGLLVYALLRARAHWILHLLLGAKIIAEQLPAFQELPAMQYTATLIDSDVVADAHLWGAVGGLIIFMAIRFVVWVKLLGELNSAS